MSSWLGTAVGAALAAVPLCWTLLVLQRHRQAWRPLDVLLAALAWQGLLQQAAALLYSLLAMSLLGPLQWCSAATWLLTSGQTLQVSQCHFVFTYAGSSVRRRQSKKLSKFNFDKILNW